MRMNALVALVAALQAATAASQTTTVTIARPNEEQWLCTFAAFGAPREQVSIRYQVFRTHVRDAFDTEWTIAQRDDLALVLVRSDYGGIGLHSENGIGRRVSVVTIDRRTRQYHQTSIKVGEPTETVSGYCDPE